MDTDLLDPLPLAVDEAGDSPKPDLTAPAPQVPTLTWQQVLAHPAFQAAPPEQKQAAVDAYAQRARAFALTLPGADPSVLEDHFGAWAARQKDAVDFTHGAAGLVTPGNIDIMNRPQVRNADGSVSTVRSIGVGTDKGEAVIPTVVGGKILSNEDAIAHFRQTGEHLGIFDTPQNGAAYATALHNQQQAALIDVGAGPGVASRAPEGSPEEQATRNARPVFANEIPSATAQSPTFDQTIAASLPQFPQSATPPLAAPDTREIGTRSFSEAYQQGGVLGALDYGSQQLPIQAAGATKKFLDVATLPETLFASPEQKQAIEAGNNVVSRVLGGFVSRENVAMLPLFALAPVRAALGAQGGIESARQLWGAIGNISKEGATQSNLEALGESGTGALMSALLFKSAFHGPTLARKINEVPDELLQAAGAESKVQNASNGVGNIVQHELDRRGLAPVPAEKLVPALAARGEATKAAQDVASVAPETAKVLTEQAQAQYKAAVTPEGELVSPDEGGAPVPGLKPAVQLENGQVHVGTAHHGEALEAADAANGGVEQPVKQFGFVNDKGQFLDRKEAATEVGATKAGFTKPQLESDALDTALRKGLPAETTVEDVSKQKEPSPLVEQTNAALDRADELAALHEQPGVAEAGAAEAAQPILAEEQPKEVINEKSSTAQGQAGEAGESNNNPEAEAQNQQRVLSETAGPEPASPPTGSTPVSEQIRKAVDALDFNQGHAGASDLANDLEGIDNLPKPLKKSLAAYREAEKSDREEFGERSGEPSLYGERLESEARKWASSETETPKKTSPPSVSVDVSPIQNAKSLDEAKTVAGGMVLKAKTDADIQAIQSELQKYGETGARPVPIPEKADFPVQEKPAKQESPTDLAHTTERDLGKALSVPKGATALRVTDQKGRQTLVRAADLKGANVLHGAGPFKKIEAGTTTKGAFSPMKERIAAKPATVSGITAPGIAARVADYLTRGGLEDEENHFEPTVKESSEELATPEGSEEAAPPEETTGEAAQSSLKAQPLAHEQATYQAVTDVLSQSDKSVGTVSPDEVSKRYATVNKVLDARGADAAGREHIYDTLRDDMLHNAETTGDPFKVQLKSGKTAAYSAKMRAEHKLQQFNELHENANLRGEEADIVGQITAAPKDTARYHEAVNYVLDATDSAVNEFAQRTGFEGHSPEAIAAATEAVLKEQGFGAGVQGRPSKEVQEILNSDTFRPAVQKTVLERIADAVQKHFDASVLDNVRLTNTGDAVSSAISGIAGLFKPGKITQIGRVARGWFGAIAGKTMPRFTAADREVGEAGARYISSQIAAEPLADVFASQVLSKGNGQFHPMRFGAMLTEDNLRDVKAQNLAKAQQAATPEEAAEYQDRAANTATMVGKGKPFKDEKEYQAFLADPNTQAAIAEHKALWESQVNPLYRSAQSIDPSEPLPSRGVQTHARVNLLAIQPGQKGVAKVSGAPPGGLTNTLKRKSPFAIEAKGTATHYETDYREMMKNTFGRQMSIATYNEFVNSMVDKGLAQIGKPGQKIEIDGEATTAYPLARRTVIKTEDGKTQVFPANQSVYVKGSLAGEFRNAVNVDPSHTSSILAKTIFRPLNNAALYGLTDATVHISNQATALFSRPAVTGSTLTDIMLSSLGRADVPVVLTKAIIKGFQDNRQQAAELAQIGALRAEAAKSGKYNPLGWTNKILHWTDKTTRLVLDDAYKQLVKEGLAVDSETNRREFVNQIGQYNRRTSSGLNRAMKDAGFAPFVTAGTTFNRLGLRTVGLQAGVEHTSALAHAITMANVASKWVGAAALIGISNYVLTHNKGGGLLGRPGVPIGNIDTGQTDENDKPVSFPAANVLGLGRALRVTGIKGAAQSARAGLTKGDVIDAGLRDVVNTAVSPYSGPTVRAGSAVLFNRSLGIGTPPVFHVVAPTGDDTQKSQIAHNLLGALGDVNPAVSAYLAKRENPSLPQSEITRRQFPRFTLQPSNAADMMENYPEIVHKAQLNSYIEDTVYTARRLKPADRSGYIEQQLSQIPAEDHERLEKALKSRRVEY